jgi:broad specificity phosphatase PhoE
MNPLWLLRHGPLDVHGAPLGWRDDPVSDAARGRWPALKTHLQTLGIRRVLSSDLRRSCELAADLGLPHEILKSLREQHFGSWDAVPWADNPDAALIYADPLKAVPPGGESFAACAARAIAGAVAALDDRPTLVLAHAGSLRAILAAFLGLPLERALDLAWDPFGLSCLDVYAPCRGVLRFHNRQVA